MSIDVRPPKESDFDDLLNIIYNTFDDPDKFKIYDDVDRRTAEANLELIKLSFVEQTTRIVSPNFIDEGIVLTWEDELVGMSGFSMLDSSENELVTRYKNEGVDLEVPSMLFTIAIRDPDEEYNRCGIGTRLAEERIKIAKERGMNKIYVVAWSGSHSAGLMKKLGFKPVVYKGSDTVVTRRCSDIPLVEEALLLELELDSY